MPPAADRRLAPRARPPRDLRLRLVGNPDVVEIRDLSASGICCTTLQPIPVMTQVHLVLLLPGSAGTDGSGAREVASDGVVVRCVRDTRRTVSPSVSQSLSQTASQTLYETAIFLTGLVDSDREALAGFVVSLRTSGLVA